MTILINDEPITTRKLKGRTRRAVTLSTKITPRELELISAASEADGRALGEWVRAVILRELREGSASDPSLAEILGVRLLLVNVLRPLAAGQRLAPEAFDKLLDEISDAKYQLASKLVSPSGRK